MNAEGAEETQKTQRIQIDSFLCVLGEPAAPSEFKKTLRIQTPLPGARHAITSLPEKIRGYGHVRKAHAANVEAQREALRTRIGQHQPELLAA